MLAVPARIPPNALRGYRIVTAPGTLLSGCAERRVVRQGDGCTFRGAQRPR